MAYAVYPSTFCTYIIISVTVQNEMYAAIMSNENSVDFRMDLL